MAKPVCTVDESAGNNKINEELKYRWIDFFVVGVVSVVIVIVV